VLLVLLLVLLVLLLLLRFILPTFFLALWELGVS
jgi:hypothetical protein